MCNEFWAVTPYFNPVGYRRRLANYRAFRAHLGMPLLTVELSATGRFELGPGDADILIQLTGETRLWQKERLINIGIRRLPAHVRHVAWIDCDVVFGNRNWSGEAAAKLEAHGGMVQLFAEAHHLPPDATLEPVSTVFERHDMVDVVQGMARQSKTPGHTFDMAELRPPRDGAQGAGAQSAASGLGWAARRDQLGPGLLDTQVAGSADIIVVLAALGLLEAFLPHRPVTAAGLAAIRAWCGRARESGLLSGIDHCEGRLAHLWHGDLGDRRYLERHMILADHGFDPARDLRRAANDTWAWREPDGPMPRRLLAYFHGRREDG